jgi:hypothetical protein
MSLTADQKLDVVLTYLNNERLKNTGEGFTPAKQQHEIGDAVKNLGVPFQELHDVLGQLSYIDFYVNSGIGYSINFKGSYFIESGGYVGATEMANAASEKTLWMNRKALENTSRLNWLTAALILVTSILLVWDALKYLHDCHCTLKDVLYN